MSDLIQECTGSNVEEWKVWYNERYPEANERIDVSIIYYEKKKNEVLAEFDPADFGRTPADF